MQFFGEVICVADNPKGSEPDMIIAGVRYLNPKARAIVIAAIHACFKYPAWGISHSGNAIYLKGDRSTLRDAVLKKIFGEPCGLVPFFTRGAQVRIFDRDLLEPLRGPE